MRRRRLSLLVAGWFVVGSLPGVSAQAPGTVPRAEAAALIGLVEAVVAGRPAGNDAWLKWNGHFMRASDGRVFVPFTLTLDDLAAPLESLAMYVRVVPRGSTATSATVRVNGSSVGAGAAVNVPERQFAHGGPTAGEASAQLGLMAQELNRVGTAFEGFFTARITGPAPVVRRSFVVPPGSYDLLIAIRERPRGRSEPRVAVLQSALTVPDLTAGELTMSSVILADRIEALDRRLSPSQQAERPYAFNSVEIFPASSSRFRPDDVLSVVLFVYNLALDGEHLPNVTVRYRFLRMSQPWKTFGEMAPQRFGSGGTPPPFDARAGRQLAVTQALPLKTFPPDLYELEVAVTDNLSGQTITGTARFTVG